MEKSEKSQEISQEQLKAEIASHPTVASKCNDFLESLIQKKQNQPKLEKCPALQEILEQIFQNIAEQRSMLQEALKEILGNVETPEELQKPVNFLLEQGISRDQIAKIIIAKETDIKEKSITLVDVLNNLWKAMIDEHFSDSQPQIQAKIANFYKNAKEAFGDILFRPVLFQKDSKHSVSYVFNDIQKGRDDIVRFRSGCREKDKVPACINYKLLDIGMNGLRENDYYNVPLNFIARYDSSMVNTKTPLRYGKITVYKFRAW